MPRLVKASQPINIFLLSEQFILAILQNFIPNLFRDQETCTLCTNFNILENYFNIQLKNGTSISILSATVNIGDLSRRQIDFLVKIIILE